MAQRPATTPTSPLQAPQTSRSWKADVPMLLAFSVIALVGFVTAMAWDSLYNARLALMWAIACFVAGAALGFLFGIPKVLQRATQRSSEELSASTITQE